MRKKLFESNSKANIRAMAGHFRWNLVCCCTDVR